METATITLTCNDCQGKGHLHATELYRGKRVDTAVPCHTCKGTGTEDVEWVMCPTCGEALCDCPDPVVVEGVAVIAPGFTEEQFTAALDRARADQLHTRPAPVSGAVIVQGASGNAYTVTRTSCTCPGHQGHGRCKHRAFACWLADVAGIDPARVPTSSAMVMQEVAA